MKRPTIAYSSAFLPVETLSSLPCEEPIIINTPPQTITATARTPAMVRRELVIVPIISDGFNTLAASSFLN